MRTEEAAASVAHAVAVVIALLMVTVALDCLVTSAYLSADGRSSLHVVPLTHDAVENHPVDTLASFFFVSPPLVLALCPVSCGAACEAQLGSEMARRVALSTREKWKEEKGRRNRAGRCDEEMNPLFKGDGDGEKSRERKLRRRQQLGSREARPDLDCDLAKGITSTMLTQYDIEEVQDHCNYVCTVFDLRSCPATRLLKMIDGLNSRTSPPSCRRLDRKLRSRGRTSIPIVIASGEGGEKERSGREVEEDVVMTR
ncbi:hypothetical protein ZIOFF_003456 [Zingiber officinale]|uniref:Uncharacterized protein n=1 Tax=Zingiber officinale TaxID=94328 RepID=A0A8J5I6I8_ZINOF|nr:hypothetical protein ZIOFF_003456 [Zingiber officinale]